MMTRTLPDRMRRHTHTPFTKPYQMRRRREALERGEDPSNIGPPSSSAPATPPDPTNDPRQNKRSKRKKK
jgi:hypothetical protein